MPNLTRHFDKLIKDLISTGRYANKSEVHRAGLRLLEEHEKSLSTETPKKKTDSSRYPLAASKETRSKDAARVLVERDKAP